MALPLLAYAQEAVTAANAAPQRWQLNMNPGVTRISENAYEAHMLALWICVVIGVLVFGAMAVAMFRFRKSKGAVADRDFTHSTKLEILWTVVPILLLVLMAFPATSKLIAMYDTRNAEMTVKVTGYQWMWKYDYLGQNVSLTSRLDRKSDEIRQSGVQPTLAQHANYLLDVDNALVLPTETKIRFVLTADDVIHAWWVPALGWKQDAIPGLINEAWTEIPTPGIYRGQCAELCGKDHAFMPIVVKAVPRAEFDQWIAAEKARLTPAGVSPATQAVPGPTPAAGRQSAPAVSGATPAG
ncbi:cytochrome c oxidase subunit II [Lysobacter korlensis]|uniref:Cytochrome c oxidase subunit 2 n=1 Tax=Lysobacter korlensis TaxID=553636 RepID=A0ABV6RR53_9GAMM